MIQPLIGDLIAFDFTKFPPGNCGVSEHLHAFHQMDVILEGSVDISVEGRGLVRLDKGDALFLPPLWRHCLSFTPAGFRQGSYKFYLGAAHFSCFPKEPVKLRMTPEVLAVIETSGIARGILASTEQVAAATVALVRFANQAASAPMGSLDRFRQRLLDVLHDVSANPFKKWAVGDLAQTLGVAGDTFTRHFIALLGRTPRQFLLETRLRAAALILATDPSSEIKQVAQAAGYESVHSFTRAFAKMTGMPPGELRKSANQDKILTLGDKDRRRPA
jgi:AraC-like DNA-binding protein